MARFRGRFDYSIDNKGRFNIPSKFRSSLDPAAGDRFIVCRAPGGCLRVYPLDVWEVYEQDLVSRPETADNVHHKRLLFSTLTDQTLDAQGRIALNSKQMELAGITKEVTLVGQADYIEVWDTEKYNIYQNDHEGDFDQVFFQSVDTDIVKRNG